MRKARKIQYTIRDVSPGVDRKLRERARDRRQSLNQIVCDALSAAAGLSEPRTYHDLDRFFGSWTSDAAVDRALADQRVVDPDLWR